MQVWTCLHGKASAVPPRSIYYIIFYSLRTNCLLSSSNIGEQRVDVPPNVGACNLRRARPASIHQDNPPGGHLQARPPAAPAYEMPPLWQACTQAGDRQSAGPARQSQPPSLWLPAASCPVRTPSCIAFIFTSTSSYCMSCDPRQSHKQLHSLPATAQLSQMQVGRSLDRAAQELAGSLQPQTGEGQVQRAQLPPPLPQRPAVPNSRPTTSTQSGLPASASRAVQGPAAGSDAEDLSSLPCTSQLSHDLNAAEQPASECRQQEASAATPQAHRPVQGLTTSCLQHLGSPVAELHQQQSDDAAQQIFGARAAHTAGPALRHGGPPAAAAPHGPKPSQSPVSQQAPAGAAACDHSQLGMQSSPVQQVTAHPRSSNVRTQFSAKAAQDDRCRFPSAWSLSLNTTTKTRPDMLCQSVALWPQCCYGQR